MQNIGFFIGIFVLSKIALGIAALSTNLRDKLLSNKKSPIFRLGFLEFNGGEGGSRTPDTLLRYAPLAGECLRPLGHFSTSAEAKQAPSQQVRHNTIIL
jgi:hypothetical protein